MWIVKLKKEKEILRVKYRCVKIFYSSTVIKLFVFHEFQPLTAPPHNCLYTSGPNRQLEELLREAVCYLTIGCYLVDLSLSRPSCRRRTRPPTTSARCRRERSTTSPSCRSCSCCCSAPLACTPSPTWRWYSHCLWSCSSPSGQCSQLRPPPPSSRHAPPTGRSHSHSKEVKLKLMYWTAYIYICVYIPYACIYSDMYIQDIYIYICIYIYVYTH